MSNVPQTQPSSLDTERKGVTSASAPANDWTSTTYLPCKFFLKGQCKFGDRCNRNHNTIGVQHVEGFDLGRSTDSEPVCHDDSGSFVPVPENTLSLADNEVNPSQKARRPQAQPCFAWKAQGTCRRGDKCRYVHSDPEHGTPTRDSPFKLRHKTTTPNEGPSSLTDNRNTSRQYKEQQAEGRRRAAEERAAEHARRMEKEKRRKAAEERAEQFRIQREAERAERAARQQEKSERAAERERRRKATEERAERIRIQREAERAEKEAKRREKEERLRIQLEERNRLEATVAHQYVVLGSTIVTFGAGVAINHVVTGFESCRVQVKNLPLDAKNHEVCEMLQAQGVENGKYHLVSLKRINTQQEATFLVDEEVGRAIAPGLNGIDFRGRALEFSINDSGPVGGMHCANNSTPLTISWRAPCVRFVVTYHDVGIADSKMRELNGRVINGRKITVELNRMRQDGSFDPYALLVSGFHPHTSDEFIGEIFQAPSVRRLRNPIDYDEEFAKVNVMNLIRGDSPDSIVRIEGPTSSVEGSYSLCVRFRAWGEAKRAHDMLHGFKHTWIGNSAFRLRLPNPIHYQITIPSQQYKAQRKQWDLFVLGEKMLKQLAC